MKKNTVVSVAKKARKVFKKELTDKIAAQLKAAIGDVGTDIKKTNKAIEKAAKNLAKKISKQAASNKKSVAKANPAAKGTEIKNVAVPEKASTPVKAKTAAAKKPAAKAE